MQYEKSYKVYFKRYGSKAKLGDSMTVIATSVKHARNVGKGELAKHRVGKVTITKVKLVRRVERTSQKTRRQEGYPWQVRTVRRLW